MPDSALAMQQHLNQFEAACRQLGLKLTHQRLEIYRELLAAADHPTAEQLHQRLRWKVPHLSLDTVYRTLATLVRHRLARRVETAESQAHFEAALDRHHHLICRECGAILDFGWPQLDTIPLPDSLQDWGRLEHRSLVVYGTCKTCLR